MEEGAAHEQSACDSVQEVDLRETIPVSSRPQGSSNVTHFLVTLPQKHGETVFRRQKEHGRDLRHSASVERGVSSACGASHLRGDSRYITRPSEVCVQRPGCSKEEEDEHERLIGEADEDLSAGEVEEWCIGEEELVVEGSGAVSLIISP